MACICRWEDGDEYKGQVHVHLCFLMVGHRKKSLSSLTATPEPQPDLQTVRFKFADTSNGPSGCDITFPSAPEANKIIDVINSKYFSKNKPAGGTTLQPSKSMQPTAPSASAAPAASAPPKPSPKKAKRDDFGDFSARNHGVFQPRKMSMGSSSASPASSSLGTGTSTSSRASPAAGAAKRQHDEFAATSRNTLPLTGKAVSTPEHRAAAAAAAATPEGTTDKRSSIDSKCITTAGNHHTPEKTQRTIRRQPPQPSGLITLPSARAAQPQVSAQYRSYRSTETFGLQNLGNTCYLNAVMQALCSLREFVGALQAMPKTLPPVAESALFNCTSRILARMTSPDANYGPLSPAMLREQIASAAPMFGGNEQQDAHEFLLEYINQLHDELLTARNRVLASKVGGLEEKDVAMPATQLYFDTELEKILVCPSCEATHSVHERFRDLSLDFCAPDGRGKLDLERLLAGYFVKEEVEVRCETCAGSTADLVKGLASAPRVLVLHLKRFVPNLATRRYDKQHQSVTCPQWLDLKAACAGEPSTLLVNGRPPARPFAEREEEAASRPVYSLRAAVAHEGDSPFNGHYVCYARGPAGWRLYNDSVTTSLGPDYVPDAAFGRKAYILFYVREFPKEE
eukprot:TRINITY_DN1043_c1_g1_i1.p1 TRINITY_DN1043_c1_g1~~TRINITY_DN1043_c1_g1_i1.p1  ORF type:complete len:627 (+),score=128.31 TRINITY_DN1043_c1_g1_i1:140-2020(+)